MRVCCEVFFCKTTVLQRKKTLVNVNKVLFYISKG